MLNRRIEAKFLGQLVVWAPGCDKADGPIVPLLKVNREQLNIEIHAKFQPISLHF